jgi:DNA-binding NarL/FixJ family response regulator
MNHAPTDHGFAEVWIVEDSVLFRETITDLLEGTGSFRCTGAFGTCEEAVAALERDELPDLVLMDIGLPGMDGIEGVGRIRGLAPALPVVMLTVHQDNDRIFQAICAGASGYLLKSAPRENLLDALRRVLGGGAALNAQIARRVLDMFAQLAPPRNDYGLSDREREILQGLVDGLTKAEIAEHLFLSPHTVDNHVRNIYAKLHVHNRSVAVAKALRERIL